MLNPCGVHASSGMPPRVGAIFVPSRTVCEFRSPAMQTPAASSTLYVSGSVISICDSPAFPKVVEYDKFKSNTDGLGCARLRSAFLLEAGLALLAYGIWALDPPRQIARRAVRYVFNTLFFGAAAELLLQRLSCEVIQRVSQHRKGEHRHPCVIQQGSAREVEDVALIGGGFVALERHAHQAHNTACRDQS